MNKLKLFIFASLMSMITVNAGERLFTLSHEARYNKPGEWEFEQHTTWQTNKHQSDQSFDRWDFRSELEYSFSEKFMMAIYFDSRYQDSGSDNSGEIDFKDVAIEAVYTFSDAVQDAIGSAFYLEAKYGDENEFFEIEAKILLTKQMGKWVFNYNFVFEHEWEHEGLSDEFGKYKNVFGVSYEVSRNFQVGLELEHSQKYTGQFGHYNADTGEDIMYLGPVFHYANESFWVTFTPTYQITEVEGTADFLSRLIVGFSF